MRKIIKLPALPIRKADVHKGDYGRVLVLAGSVGMAGAACMCSEAVLRGGAGLVTLGIPESLYPIAASRVSLAVMTRPLPETRQKTLSYKARWAINELAQGFDVLALGPGLSRNPDTQELVLWILENIPLPMVVDADALNAVSTRPSVLNKVQRDCIVTPHPGEMARLLGGSTAGVWASADEVQRDRRGAVEEFLKRYPALTLVLKGHKTLVADSQRLFINTTGNPGMATAGTGDVLTGLIAGLLAPYLIGTGLAQGLKTPAVLPPFEAAQLGVYLHGLAGDLAAAEKGEISLIATDVLDKLPEA
ncbi:MAG TPA: NAD(P)H-hydrate dehydratase, partial [Candidatus Tripitaka sp. YC43]